MYRFLLNNTRNQAILIPSDDDTDAEEKYYNTISLTKTLQPYQHLIKDWAFTDDIMLYQESVSISYTTLGKYQELNFITYNKEAHLI
jgi:hypothetical protein